jgi:hypothetical protein
MPPGHPVNGTNVELRVTKLAPTRTLRFAQSRAHPANRDRIRSSAAARSLLALRRRRGRWRDLPAGGL